MGRRFKPYCVNMAVKVFLETLNTSTGCFTTVCPLNIVGRFNMDACRISKLYSPISKNIFSISINAIVDFNRMTSLQCRGYRLIGSNFLRQVQTQRSIIDCHILAFRIFPQVCVLCF